jgi:hypothetical protein
LCCDDFGWSVGDYGGIVGQVWRLFTQGSQYLTPGAIFQIAGRVVRNAVPWYKVASITFHSVHVCGQQLKFKKYETQK